VALAANESKVTAMRVWFVVSSLVVFGFAMTKGLFGRVENERIGGKWMKVVAEWNFDKAGDLQGWQPNAQITDIKVANGVLSFRTVGDDPILYLRAPFEIPASPWHVIEIRMRATSDGMAEFFWSNTTEPPYEGFRPHKRTSFWVVGDGKWRTYRILPFWHPEGKIIRFRFDPFDGANFEIDFIRIVELEVERVTKGEGRVAEWLAFGDVKVERGKEGWFVTLQSPDAFLTLARFRRCRPTAFRFRSNVVDSRNSRHFVFRQRKIARLAQPFLSHHR
jgi:hypothetical protein